MIDEQLLKDALDSHPCFNSDAHKQFARMHIPVAPRCNIQCNYCNRKFDCCNESRPGVTSEILTPRQAADKLAYVRSKIPELKVIGIAGPGDPLANESTFEALELIGKENPDLTLCVSTNGLALPDNAKRLYDLGVRFITVTMNACDPEIGSKVYSFVNLNGKVHKGADASKILIERQTEGIRLCSEMGMLVKVNIVMIPGINDSHIPDLVRYVKSNGAYIVNILPLIPVEGTAFENLHAPTPKERREMMDRCSLDVKMMRHCRQCRADAIGRLDEDRSQEFVHISGCGGGCGPGTPVNVSIDCEGDPSLFAVASTDGRSVDSGFGNAIRFRIFSSDGKTCNFIEDRTVPASEGVSGDDHKKHIKDIADLIKDCKTVVVTEIGPLPSKVLSNIGMKIIESEGDAVETIIRSFRD